MALNDDPKKKPYKSALAAPNVAAPAMGALPAVASWAMNRPEPKGFNPVMPDYTKPNPTNKPVMLTNPPIATPAAKPAAKPAAPVIASPGASATQARQSPGSVPTQSPASTPTGAGASSAAGGAAPKPYTLRPDGVAVVKVSNGSNAYGATGASVANAQGRMGSVNTQNFGNPVVPQAQASIARPGVASTFGLGVNDPRLDSQIARPPVQLGPNQTAGGGTLASPSSMGRYYANKEDREATQKLLGDIDTQMFMARGKNTPSARRLMAELAGTKAQVIGNMAGNTNAQISDNTRGEFGLANTGMEQAGATQRQQMAGDVAREGNLLDFNASMANTAVSLIEKPQYVTDRTGNLVQVAGGKGTGVTGADGAVIQMPQTQQENSGAVQPKDALAVINKELASLINNPPEMGGDATAHNARIAELRAQQAAYLGGQQGGQAQAAKVTSKADLDKLPKGARYLAPDGQVYIKN